MSKKIFGNWSVCQLAFVFPYVWRLVFQQVTWKSVVPSNKYRHVYQHLAFQFTYSAMALKRAQFFRPYNVPLCHPRSLLHQREAVAKEDCLYCVLAYVHERARTFAIYTRGFTATTRNSNIG